MGPEDIGSNSAKNIKAQKADAAAKAAEEAYTTAKAEADGYGVASRDARAFGNTVKKERGDVADTLKQQCRDKLMKDALQKQDKQCDKDKQKTEQSFGNQIVRKPDGSRGRRCEYGVVCDPTLSVNAPIELSFSGKCTSGGSGAITCSVAKIKCDSEYGQGGCRCNPPPPAPPPPPDVCSNLAGVQYTIPDGYIDSGDGRCVPGAAPIRASVCPNLPGYYAAIPAGYTKYEGKCIKFSAPRSPLTTPVVTRESFRPVEECRVSRPEPVADLRRRNTARR